MVEGNFPSAVFGKPHGATAYQIIQQHEAFEQADIAKCFRKICTSFEWKPTAGDTQHQPCFATIQCREVILIARYTDRGRDTLDRPHTLRVDCMLSDANDLEKAWAVLRVTPPIPAPSQTLKIFGTPNTFTQAQPT